MCVSLNMTEEISVLLESTAALPVTPQHAQGQQQVEGITKLETTTSIIGGELPSSCTFSPLTYRIALEHSYAKLVPFRSTHGSGGKESSLATIVLFPDRVKTKLKKRRKKQLKLAKGMTGMVEVHGAPGGNHGEVSNEEGDSTLTTTAVYPTTAEESTGCGGVNR